MWQATSMRILSRATDAHFGEINSTQPHLSCRYSFLPYYPKNQLTTPALSSTYPNHVP